MFIHSITGNISDYDSHAFENAFSNCSIKLELYHINFVFKKKKRRKEE